MKFRVITTTKMSFESVSLLEVDQPSYSHLSVAILRLRACKWDPDYITAMCSAAQALDARRLLDIARTVRMDELERLDHNHMSTAHSAISSVLTDVAVLCEHLELAKFVEEHMHNSSVLICQAIERNRGAFAIQVIREMHVDAVLRFFSTDLWVCDIGRRVSNAFVFAMADRMKEKTRAFHPDEVQSVSCLLFYASLQGLAPACERLLEFNVSLTHCFETAPEYVPMTCLDAALYNCHPDVVLLLSSRGAKMNMFERTLTSVMTEQFGRIPPQMFPHLCRYFTQSASEVERDARRRVQYSRTVSLASKLANEAIAFAVKHTHATFVQFLLALAIPTRDDVMALIASRPFRDEHIDVLHVLAERDIRLVSQCSNVHSTALSHPHLLRTNWKWFVVVACATRSVTSTATEHSDTLFSLWTPAETCTYPAPEGGDVDDEENANANADISIDTLAYLAATSCRDETFYSCKSGITPAQMHIVKQIVEMRRTGQLETLEGAARLVGANPYSFVQLSKQLGFVSSTPAV